MTVRLLRTFNLLFFTGFFAELIEAVTFGKIVYAINAGGDTHVDVFGIRYEKDPLSGKIGIASDYGKQLIIGRVPQNDHILYQTERYHTNTFGYDIPLREDGDYVLVLKFCEVYFNAPNQKVFDVVLNGEHTVVADLDIFDKVGRGVAYDEYIPFSISDGRLYYNDEESDIKGWKVKVEFIKGYRDNPKVNAIYVVKGKLEDIPKLSPLPEAEEWRADEEAEPEEKSAPGTGKVRNPSGPRTPDPYSTQDTSLMVPVFIAIGAFLPLLLCMCRL